MDRKFIAFFLCMILLCSLPINVSASLQEEPYVVDNAGILKEQELLTLDSAAHQLSQTYGLDILIATVNSLDGQSAQDYAENLYTGTLWNSENTLLFLLAMEEREWYISTCGEAIYIFTDYGLDMLGELALPYLSEGDYYGAFAAYLDALPEYFKANEEGVPIDGHVSNYDPYTEEIMYDRDAVVYRQPKVNHFISLIIGVVVAVVVILIMRGSMNTKHRQNSAGDYMKAGSYHLRNHTDLFLYSNVSKVRRQQNNSSGGSSVHRSSGGRRHGGRGGRF